jgi:type IV secretion system protein VirD4
VIAGRPLTIYLVLPPNRLHSHRGLLKLWVSSLLAAIFTGRAPTAQRTLFLLDEAAQLESFPPLETLMTLSAGFGAIAHTFWQDLAQLKSCYPTSWPTLLNNCGVIQAFGIYNRSMAVQWSDYFDHSVHQFRGLRPEEQVLSIHGRGEMIARRLNYLVDPSFRGRFDGNRLHDGPAPVGEASRAPR